MDYSEINSVEELDQAIAALNEQARPLVEKGRNGEPLTSEERTQLREIAADVTAATERRTAVQADLDAAAAEQDELLSQFPEAEVEAPPEPTEPEAPEAEAPAPVEPAEPVAPVEPVAEETPVVEPAPAVEPVAATTRAPVTTAPRRRVAPHAKPRTADERQAAKGYGSSSALVASVNSQFSQKHDVVEWADAEALLMDTVSRFTAPSGNGRGRRLEKTPLVQLQVKRDEQFVLTGDEEADAEKIRNARDPRRTMANGAQGLVAAGGWCAPSEIIYDIPVVGENATDGLLSIPEMVATRGGVKSTPGPVWADLYAAIGFHQTETEAIAGETKDCYEIPCPAFTETRLEVEGVCIIVPILTEAGYPEVVARYMSGAATVHVRKMNAFKLAALETASTAKNAIDLATTAQSTLHGLALRADYMRSVYRMGFEDVLEVVLPFWVLEYLIADLEQRMGHDPADGPITRADVEAYFAARNLAVQWVYDWQNPVEPAAEAASFKALMYPAGTFLGLTKDVISLGAVYDSNALATNTYTGMFSEEGIAVRKMSGTSEVVTIPICSKGQVGAANLTCS